MTAFLLAGPAEEPVSLVEAKAFLRVDDDAEDELIGTLITAARLHCEGITGKALIHQSWRLVLDCWPADRAIALPVAPLASLTSILVISEDGAAQTLAHEDVIIQPHRLLLPLAFNAAIAPRERAGIEIDFVAGYGATAADVPTDFRQAVMILIGHWFENRSAVVIAGSGAVVPNGFDTLLSRHRRVAL